MTMPACAIEPVAADGEVPEGPEDGAADPSPQAAEPREEDADHPLPADHPLLADHLVPEDAQRPGDSQLPEGPLTPAGSLIPVPVEYLVPADRDTTPVFAGTTGSGSPADPPVADRESPSNRLIAEGREADPRHPRHPRHPMTTDSGASADHPIPTAGGSRTARSITADHEVPPHHLLATDRTSPADHPLATDHGVRADHPLATVPGARADHVTATVPGARAARSIAADRGARADRGAQADRAARAGCVIAAGGAYAARLARDGDCWFPERWTLDGPEPYAVPLPGNQPEEPGTEVQPMADGRVLIRRPTDGRHAFSLLYPTGPGTGELPLGAVACPDEGTLLRLLPPAPCGERAYALAVGRRATAVWLVAGGTFGPEHLAEIPGRCSGGVWLDRTGRMLALDQELGGRTKTIVVDLERGGEVSPLLQIAADSDDRLLLADPDSGLLLISSDAPSPGEARLGWGVLGSTLPVRFPECLHPPDLVLTPFASQPGQALLPEGCAVALRVDGAYGCWVGVWRPADRRLYQLHAPEGWLAGSGLWTPEGVLRLPYATDAEPCGVASLTAPLTAPSSPSPSAWPSSSQSPSPSPSRSVSRSGGASPPDGLPKPVPTAPRPVPSSRPRSADL